MHQNAHNTLAELDEAVPETKKVTDFLASITDSRISNAKDLILGDPNKLQNFEACQQYLKTLVYNKATQEKHERHISGLLQEQGKTPNKPDGGRDKNQTGKRPGGGNNADNGKVVAHQYTKAEWAKLTPDQRAKIKEMRANKRRKTPGNRNASGVQVDDSNAPHVGESPTPPATTAHYISQVTTPTATPRGAQVPPTTSRGVRFVERND
jgi:hypothetical protein